MKFFFFVETIPFSYEIVYNLLIYINELNRDYIPTDVLNYFKWFNLLLLLTYPLLQAYGILFLKDSKDPLQGISMLGLVTIMSQNQITTPDFVDQMENGLQYKQLDKEKQLQIMAQLKKSSLSLTPSTIPSAENSFEGSFDQGF